ncbi:MAG: WG repeat-containing protein [Negativicutes bacterium]|nr:WG repeat-containing protein [Negativicutes bacterium]
MQKIFGAVIVLSLLLALQLSGFAAPDDGGRLFSVINGHRAGFIDASGTVIIPLQFSDVREFAEGLAPAQAADSGKWGYIDRTGAFVIPPQYKMAFPFSEGLAEVWLEPSGGGYIDDTGQMVINGNGGRVSGGLVFIRAKDNTIVTDKNGVKLFEAPGEAWLVSDGRIAFIENGKMGFMDRAGKVVIRPTYHRVIYWRDREFEEQITPVSIDAGGGKSKYGFIDRTGKTVVDFQFDWAEQFFEGLAMVSKDGKHGYVNTAGEVVISLQFDLADHFAEGLAAVAVNGRWGFIDKQGRMVIAPQYLPRMWGSPMLFSDGLAAVRTDTGTGFINKAGEMVVPAVYRSVEDFSGGLARVRPFDPTTYVNRWGEVVWPRD